MIVLVCDGCGENQPLMAVQTAVVVVGKLSFCKLACAVDYAKGRDLAAAEGGSLPSFSAAAEGGSALPALSHEVEPWYAGLDSVLEIAAVERAGLSELRRFRKRLVGYLEAPLSRSPSGQPMSAAVQEHIHAVTATMLRREREMASMVTLNHLRVLRADIQNTVTRFRPTKAGAS